MNAIRDRVQLIPAPALGGFLAIVEGEQLPTVHPMPGDAAEYAYRHLAIKHPSGRIHDAAMAMLEHDGH